MTAFAAPVLPQDDAAIACRAARAARLLLAVTTHTIPREQVYDCFSRRGFQAVMIREQKRGPVSLILPGTGYRAGAAPEWIRDWWCNMKSSVSIAKKVMAMPVEGVSQRLWAWGYLAAADSIDDWLGPRMEVDMVAGHSQGGAIAQILRWSRSGQIAECHAIASARPCYSLDCPIDDQIHVWAGQDDPVPRIPFGAKHIGLVHQLPATGGFVLRRHGMAGYTSRLDAYRHSLGATAPLATPTKKGTPFEVPRSVQPLQN